jgi:hypothetical protein
MKLRTRWALRRRYILRGAGEGIIQIEALMNALARARRSSNPAAVTAAEAAIKRSALKIAVEDKQYVIDLLPGEQDPDMEKIGESALAKAGVSVTGELDVYGRPISAYMQIERFIIPWETKVWLPWRRREETRKRELLLAYANYFQSQITQATPPR